MKSRGAILCHRDFQPALVILHNLSVLRARADRLVLDGTVLPLEVEEDAEHQRRQDSKNGEENIARRAAEIEVVQVPQSSDQDQGKPDAGLEQKFTIYYITLLEH